VLAGVDHRKPDFHRDVRYATMATELIATIPAHGAELPSEQTNVCARIAGRDAISYGRRSGLSVAGHKLPNRLFGLCCRSLGALEVRTSQPP
jgi:hypothetical protein